MDRNPTFGVVRSLSDLHRAASARQLTREECDTMQRAIATVQAALAAAHEATAEYAATTCYDHEDDEIGHRACCQVLSFEPHSTYCVATASSDALAAARVFPPSES